MGNTQILEELFGNSAYQRLVSEINDFAIMHLDLKGHIVSWNAGARQIFGYSAQDAIGQHFEIIFTPEDRTQKIQEEELERAQKEGRAEDVRWHLAAGGSRVFINGVTTALYNEQGLLLGYAKMGRDDTHRKLAEDALTASNLRTNNILESITDAFFALDRNWRFTYVNRQAETLLFRQREDLLGKNVWEEFPEAVGSTFERQYHKAVSDNVSADFEEFYPPLNTWFEVRAYPSADGLSVYFHNINERKRVETLLRESEQKYSTLADLVPQLVWMAEPDGYISWYNQNWYDYTGTTPEEMEGWGWQSVHDPGLLPVIVEKWKYSIQTGEPFEMEFPLRGADGKFRWFLTRVNPLRNSAGKIIRWFGTNTDIDEHRQTKAELEEVNALLDTLFDEAPIGIGYWDNRLRFSRVNKALAEMNGVSVEEHIGKTVAELLPELSEGVAEAFRRVLELGEPLTNLEATGKTPASPYEERVWNVSYYPINLRGSTSGVGAVCEEITERKRLENRNRFIMQLDEAVRPLTTPEDITLTLARLLGEYLGADRCAYAEVEADEDHFYIPGDYTRDDMHSIVGRYSMSQFGTEVLRLMRANEPYIVHDVDNDSRVSESDLASYRLTGIQAVICVPLHKNNCFSACMAVHQKMPRRWTTEEVELVTFVANRFWESIERARIVKSLHESLAREQEARKVAEEANRLKDEFLATVSHELRTPLNAILGWSNLLRSGQVKGEATSKAVETIERNARSQAQLIDDLLDISRIITGKLRLEVQPVELTNVIESAVEAIRPAAEAKNIRLQVLLDTESDSVSGDPHRLQQIVWNLLSNAVKFTPKDGRVTVRLERVNSHIEIIVSDTGKGIEPEFLPYVFERFRQADQATTRKHGGLGLGLSIVQQLVQMHGGEVSAQSEGNGATFVVKLPRMITIHSKDQEQRIHPTTSKVFIPVVSDSELTGLRILVVDDEPDSLEMLQMVLEKCGAKTSTASSAAEALERLANTSIDVLVSDIGMPGEDGYSLISKVRSLPDEKGGRIPAIALTAYARVEDRIRSLTAGFQVHVPKPVEPVELVAVILSLAKGIGRLKS